MRNAFVVLVSLCIGLVFGFIVPSRVPEPTTNDTSSNTSTTTKNVEGRTNTAHSKYAVLPNSRSDIDEKDLYEHATEKNKNQSERAFVYINQIYKKPVRNRVVKILPVAKPKQGYVSVTLPPKLQIVARTPCPSTFDSGSKSNSYFRVYDFPDKLTQELASHFVVPNIIKCNFNDNTKKTPEIAKAKVQLSTPNRVEERRDYFELLKPPILRPVHRGNSKANYEDTNHNELPSLSPPNLPYKENYLKKYNLKNQYLSKAKAALSRHDDLQKKYGYDGAFIPRPPYQDKIDISRVDDVNFEGDFIHEDDSHRMYEQEDDKLLDKYLKDTLEEQTTNNDKTSASTTECSYRDCILQSSKHYKNNGLLIKPDCKCRKRLNLKQVDLYFPRDRSLREETKRNETVPKSSEMNYYEELLSDDSNMIKQDDDVIRPSKNFSDTSAH